MSLHHSICHIKQYNTKHAQKLHAKPHLHYQTYSTVVDLDAIKEINADNTGGAHSQVQEVLVPGIDSQEKINAVHTFLKKCENLQLISMLSIENNEEMTEDKYRQLADVLNGRKVDKLYLQKCNLNNKKLSQFCKGLKKDRCQINEISIAKNTDLEPKAFAQLANIIKKSQAEGLSIEDCNLTREKLIQFREKLHCHSLKVTYLKVSENKDMGIHEFEELGKILVQADIKHLHMNNCGLTKEKLDAFCHSLDSNYKLVELQVDENVEMHPETFCSLANIAVKTKLSRLSMANCNLNKGKLEKFAEKIESMQLKELKLNVTKIFNTEQEKRQANREIKQTVPILCKVIKFVNGHIDLSGWNFCAKDKKALKNTVDESATLRSSVRLCVDSWTPEYIQKCKSPEKVEDLQVKQIDSGILVSWKKSKDDCVKYLVNVYCNGREMTEPHEINRPAYLLRSPNVSKIYQFEVWATNSHGSGEKSETSEVHLIPAKLTEVKAEQEGQFINVSWKKPKNDKVRYCIQGFCNGEIWGEVIMTSEQKYQFTPPEPSKVYHFKVWARNMFDTDGEAATSTRVILPPAKLKEVKAEMDNKFIDVFWNKPENDEVQYCIQGFCNDEKRGEVIMISEPKYQFTSPEPSKVYHFEVWARNSFDIDGEAATSNTIILPPAKLTEVNAEQGNQFINVSWKKPKNEEVRCCIQGFCNNEKWGEVVMTSEPKYQFAPPEPSKVYHFKVWARNMFDTDGEAATSNEIRLPPAKLKEVKAEQEGEFINVSWKKPKNDEAQYCIQGFCNDGEWGEVIRTSEPKYQFTSLEPSKKYYFKVWAVNSFNIDGEVTTSKTIIFSHFHVGKIVADQDEEKIIISWGQPINNDVTYMMKVFCNGKFVQDIDIDIDTNKYTYEPPDHSDEQNEQYTFNVCARSIDGTEENPLMSEPITFLVFLGHGVYIDRTNVLRKDYQVYEGQFRRTGGQYKEKVAVKVIQLTAQKSKIANEIDIISKVDDHQNTVSYRMSGSHKAWGYYIAMELCNKDTLYELVTNSAHDIDFMVALLHIMLGLLFIHSKGILHRDLKPQNVLLSLDERNMKIADFGLSKQMDPQKSKASKSKREIGTDGWGSPEHYIKGEPMSEKSDIFSAGLVFYFVLSKGKHPYGQKEYPWKGGIIDDEEKDLNSLDCPDKEIAKNLISQMLEREANVRPTAEEVLKHPFFWDVDKKMNFITNFHKHFKKSKEISFNSWMEQCEVVKEVKSKGDELIKGNWLDVLSHDCNNKALVQKAEEKKNKTSSEYKYNHSSVLELIRFFRNVAEHFTEEEEKDLKLENSADVWDAFKCLVPDLLCILCSVLNKYRKTEKKIPGDLEKSLKEAAKYEPLTTAS